MCAYAPYRISDMLQRSQTPRNLPMCPNRPLHCYRHLTSPRSCRSLLQIFLKYITVVAVHIPRCGQKQMGYLLSAHAPGLSHVCRNPSTSQQARRIKCIRVTSEHGNKLHYISKRKYYSRFNFFLIFYLERYTFFSCILVIQLQCKINV